MKIPKEAMKVVEIIRRESKKPEELPRMVLCGSSPHDSLRFDKDISGFTYPACPMGLCNNSLNPIPSSRFSFGYEEASNQEVRSFWKWWDAQTNAQEAVDAVWGK